MNLQLKNFLLICVKNAVNALLTSTALMAMNWGAFNVKSVDGWWNLGKVILAVIASREATVWVPQLLKWSQTSADPSSVILPGGGMETPPKKP